MKISHLLSILIILVIATTSVNAQYVQPERDDTIRLFAKTPFDSVAARSALAKGKSTIKGVAFTRPAGYLGENIGFGVRAGKKILANKITIILFPLTPYLTDYLNVKKKENPKKLKFAYIDPVVWRYRLTAITNSDGEFTFPEMKPGKYYLEAILPWNEKRSFDAYKGSSYNDYDGDTDHYQRVYYNQSYYDKLTKFVEVKSDGEVVDVKLK